MYFFKKMKDFKYILKLPFRFLKNVWLFRKELWNFREFDYRFNLQIFMRSLELTSRHLDGGCCVSEGKQEEAENIREFIRLMKFADAPEDEAERLTGILLNEAYSNFGDGITKRDYKWMKNDPSTWTENQKKYIIYNEKCKQIELEYWEKGMNLLREEMRSWWD
jgi:hypothetical protein